MSLDKGHHRVLRDKTMSLYVASLPLLALYGCQTVLFLSRLVLGLAGSSSLAIDVPAIPSAHGFANKALLLSAAGLRGASPASLSGTC